MRALTLADGALEGMSARCAESLRGCAERSEDFLAKQRDRSLRCLDALKQEIENLAGPLTLAQIAAGVACGYMDFRYPEDAWRGRRPGLTRWYDAFAQRNSTQRTLPGETPQRPQA